MFKYFFIFILIIYILYKLFPFLLRMFILKKTQDFSKKMNQQQQRQQRSSQYDNASQTDNKIFSKNEGEYVHFEEIEEDTK